MFFLKKVNAAVILMQKDEAAILPAWLTYYKRLVGPGNIFIIDNGSEDESVRALLRRAAADGVTVLYQPGRDVFDRKGEVVQELARGLVGYDVVLPLDADEFLGVLKDDAPDCRPRAVRRELRRFLRSGDELGLLRNAFVNVPGTALVRPQPCRKVIMRPQAARRLTKGYHFPQTFTDGWETTLCHVHFHRRGSVEEMRRSALQKLPVGGIGNVRAYRGAGFHMKHFLTMSEDEYRVRFSAESGIDISPVFAKLGHTVPYSVWTHQQAAAMPSYAAEPRAREFGLLDQVRRGLHRARARLLGSEGVLSGQAGSQG